MNIHAIKSLFFPAVLLCLFLTESHAQQGTISINQDPKFDQMLTAKRRLNPSLTIADKYKIQIFNGDSETSKKTLNSFRSDMQNMDATIFFSTPTYKVWVGSFKTRIEAERNLAELKKKYPSAIVIKPNRS